MIIKRVVLKNIRSYVEQAIDFPEGTVLLSGDIGSGKSTILLAIEFALFGLLRAELAGTSLLRNGASNGLVELKFSLGNKEYCIGRTLKRTKTSVEQGAGYLIVDDARQEMTSQELKTFVLELFGYPAEMLTKSKNALYRFTVYTPQEEMKRILQSSSDERMDVLRKVFNLDKYKRIQENTSRYLSVLRERSRELQGKTSDIPQKKTTLESLRKESSSVQTALKELEPKGKQFSIQLSEQNSKLLQMEQQLRQVFETKKEHELLKQQQNYHQQQYSANSKELQMIRQQLNAAPLIYAEPAGVEQSLKQAEQQMQSIETERSMMSRQMGELQAQHNHHKTLQEKITQMDSCPVCLQQVNETHKHAISTKATSEMSSAKEKLDVFSTKIGQLESTRTALSMQVMQLRQQYQQALKANAEQQIRTKQDEKARELAIKIAEQEKHIKITTEKMAQILLELQKTATIEQSLQNEKQKLLEIQTQERNFAVQISRFQEKTTMLSKQEAELTKEISQKEEMQKSLAKQQLFQHWLDEHFMGMVALIEKQVLAKIYNEFNATFQKWFGTLVEDELIIARLDDLFAPILQQNGYDMPFEDLSGGEKTACALAYRLALNKVINDVVSTITTRDLIILDEPTDGFSDEQLDKMREVIQELGMRQVILVSHERKIESFVDRVLRVEKENHCSMVTP